MSNQRDALRMTNNEYGFLETFRQTDREPYPIYLAKELWSNNTISSLKRKGWIEVDVENYRMTELGSKVFYAACDQQFHNDFLA